MDRETRLHEEVTQWEYPELPLFGDAEDFRPVPWVVAKRLLTFCNESLALLFCLCRRNVERSCCLREVGDEEVAQEGDGEGYNSADDE